MMDWARSRVTRELFLAKGERVCRHAAMHLQIIKASAQLTRRYVANGPHCSPVKRKPQRGRNRTSGWNVKWPAIRAWGRYHSRVYWIDGRRIRAATKAPQRKRPCRSRATARRSLLPPSFGYAKRRNAIGARLRRGNGHDFIRLLGAQNDDRHRSR
jgi:hypothetical protein